MRKLTSRWSVFAGGAALATATLALAASPAMAATGPFANGNFTQTTFQFDASTTEWVTLYAGGTQQLSDWTVTSGSVDLIGNYWQAPPGGGNSLDMDGNTQGAISQTFSTNPGTEYFVQFQLSGNPDAGTGTKTLQVQASGTAAQSYNFTVTSSISHSNMGWQTEGYTFLASSGTSSTTLNFASQTPGAWGPVLGYVTVTPIAASGAECKDGGWQTLNNPTTLSPFQNQGACVSYFATSGATPIGS